jgi:hypothetical protein
MLSVSLSVKFRIFFTDLYKFDQTWILPLPVPPGASASETLLDFNGRGVHLVITFKP